MQRWWEMKCVSEPWVHMLLVYHNHVFIHLLLFSPAILSLPPQLSLSSLALLFFITHPLIQYSPYLPFLFNPSSTTPPRPLLHAVFEGVFAQGWNCSTDPPCRKALYWLYQHYEVAWGGIKRKEAKGWDESGCWSMIASVCVYMSEGMIYGNSSRLTRRATAVFVFGNRQ